MRLSKHYHIDLLIIRANQFRAIQLNSPTDKIIDTTEEMDV